MDPVTGTPRFKYGGDYSELGKYDRTDDFMLFEVDSDFGRQFVADFKQEAHDNGETIHYLGEGPEGSMYGFMRNGAPPPPSTTSADPQGDRGYYAMKAREFAEEEAVIVPGAECTLTNLSDPRYRDLACCVLAWDSGKRRFAVRVRDRQVSILVRPDALTLKR